MQRELLEVLENTCVAPDHFIIRFKSSNIAKKAKPGQFVQVSVGNDTEPLLARPFSFLDTDATSFSILYQVVGKGTQLLTQYKNKDKLYVLGPLGNGWQTKPLLNKKHTKWILVGGGVGIPPLFHLTKTLLNLPKGQRQNKKDITVLLGGRNQKLLHCARDFKSLGIDLKLSTDDGSKGHKGLVSYLLEEKLHELEDDLASAIIFTCGPTPMLKAISEIAQARNVNCQVSVEEPMPCGFGACLGCAIALHCQTQSSGLRFAMSCTEGPVFNANDIAWNKL